MCKLQNLSKFLIYLFSKGSEDYGEHRASLLQNPRREDLEKMEKQKAEIDVGADKRLHRELWFRLVFLNLMVGGFNFFLGILVSRELIL